MGILDRLFGRSSTATTPTEAEAQAQPKLTVRPAFAVIDLETTGLSPYSDRVVEIAILRIDADGTPVDHWSTRVNPEGPVGATFIHGIRDEDVASAPTFAQLAPQIAGALSGLPLVAHNAEFDVAFLSQEFWHAGWDLPPIAYYCTLSASEHLLPDLDRRRLADCCWATHIPLEGSHSALGDAQAVAQLFRYFHQHTGYPTAQDVGWAPPGLQDMHAWPTQPARSSQPRTIRPPQSRREVQVARIQADVARERGRPALLPQLTALTLAEVVGEGAPDGTVPYLSLLLDVLEDGQITAGEASALEALQRMYGIEDATIGAAHEAFMLALAHRAVDDGVVTADERAELRNLAAALQLPDSTVKRVLDEADTSRLTRLGEHLPPLPAPWDLGEPLRVGDRVAFTGDMADREQLEDRARALGIRVMNNVSRLTTVLVTDGSFWGGKRDDAERLGTRLVDPATLSLLLDHLQPARPTPPPPPPRSDSAPSHAKTAERSAPYPSVPMSATPSEIRAWGASVGLDVGIRGRLSKELITAYEHAHAAQPSLPPDN